MFTRAPKKQRTGLGHKFTAPFVGRVVVGGISPVCGHVSWRNLNFLGHVATTPAQYDWDRCHWRYPAGILDSRSAHVEAHQEGARILREIVLVSKRCGEARIEGECYGEGRGFRYLITGPGHPHPLNDLHNFA